jgi:hypothetical protein
MVSVALMVAENCCEAVTRTWIVWPSETVPGALVYTPPLIEYSPPVMETGVLELMPDTTIGSDVTAIAGAFPLWAGKEKAVGVVSTTEGWDPEPPPPPHPTSSASNDPIKTKRGK